MLETIFLDNNKCQDSCNKILNEQHVIDWNYCRRLWEATYIDKQSSMLSTSHATGMITLLVHKYHNNRYFMWPRVFQTALHGTPSQEAALQLYKCMNTSYP
jgi:hypothetical protein